MNFSWYSDSESLRTSLQSLTICLKISLRFHPGVHPYFLQVSLDRAIISYSAPFQTENISIQNYKIRTPLNLKDFKFVRSNFRLEGRRSLKGLRYTLQASRILTPIFSLPPTTWGVDNQFQSKRRI